MGTIFPTFIRLIFLGLASALLAPSLLFASEPLLAQDLIQLPEEPPEYQSPRVSPEQAQENLNRKRQHLKDKINELRDPEASPTEKRNKALSRDAYKPRPLVFMHQISLVQPVASTSGGRESYHLDLTSHFSFFIRYNQKRPVDEIQTWWGFRFAPFAGSGIQSGIPGRFGFFYFGPMIAVGRVHKALNPAPAKAGGSKDDSAAQRDPFPTRSGWMVSTGIAAQSRQGEVDPPEAAGSDFSTTRGADFDSPGLWLEISYLKIYFGALGVNSITGVQLGQGKMLVWAGVAAAGWY